MEEEKRNRVGDKGRKGVNRWKKARGKEKKKGRQASTYFEQ